MAAFGLLATIWLVTVATPSFSHSQTAEPRHLAHYRCLPIRINCIQDTSLRASAGQTKRQRSRDGNTGWYVIICSLGRVAFMQSLIGPSIWRRELAGLLRRAAKVLGSGEGRLHSIHWLGWWVLEDTGLGATTTPTPASVLLTHRRSLVLRFIFLVLVFLSLV